jgi:multidrug efflux pump subunit AcrA (membrane-fusion protein)
MRRRWIVATTTAAVTVAAAVVVAMSFANKSSPATAEPPVTTAPVARGTLSSEVSLAGTLTFRARSDGSPYTAINQAEGVYTKVPEVGDKINCGDELYRVDDQPVVLLCGTIPAYRALHVGDAGDDVHQLDTNLHTLGYDTAAGVDIDPNDNTFTDNTEKALEKLQAAKGVPASGALAATDVVFLPEAARIAKVSVQLGASAQPGTPVLDATSDTLEVQASLEGSQQDEIKAGDRAQITLPDNTSVTGKVEKLGTVAQAPAAPNGNAGPGPATIPAEIALDDPGQAGGLDQAPVEVEITTQGVDNVLNVPVTAILGNAGGGYAVEVLRDGGRRELTAVKLGLFDDTAGRVQIQGDVREGDQVVVPSP